MFEHSLIGLQERKTSRRGWFSLPVAILIHVAAAGTFAFASYWNVDEVAEPSLNVVFFTQAAPPPPPPRGSGEAPKPAAKPVEVKPVPAPSAPRILPQQPVQPEVVPDEVPQASASSVIDAVAGLPPGGHPDGVDEGGVEGGDPNIGVPYSNGDGGPGTPAVVPAPAPDNEPIQVGGAVKKPEPLHQPPPRYTEVARRANVQGVVVLQAVIDERGNVTDVRVLRGLPMGLEQAAIDAVRTWRYRPATLHGRPMKVYFNLTVNFQLQR